MNHNNVIMHEIQNEIHIYIFYYDIIWHDVIWYLDGEDLGLSP